jgi:hypothetical protein
MEYLFFKIIVCTVKRIKNIERINFLKAAGILSTKGHKNPPQLEVLKKLSTNLKDFC